MGGSFHWGEPSTNRERINEWAGSRGFVDSIVDGLSRCPLSECSGRAFTLRRKEGGEVLRELGGELRVHGRLLSGNTFLVTD